jgi:hypothetical protein
LLKRPARFFTLASYHDDEGTRVPLAGKGLVLGSNAQGDTTAAKVSLDWIEGQVRFYELIGRALIPAYEPWHPAHARAAIHPTHGTVN